MIQSVYVSNSSDSLVGGIPTAFYFKGVSVEPLYHFNSFVTFFGGLSLSSVNTSGGIAFVPVLYRWPGNPNNRYKQNDISTLTQCTGSMFCFVAFSMGWGIL